MDVVDSLSPAPGTDSVPSLDFDLITDGDSGNIWCEQCKVFKKNYEKLQEEHARSYNTLKKKIISTDLLIKKYKTKCEEYDQQTRKLEDAIRRQEQLQRETDTLQAQLSSALHQIEPIKQVRYIYKLNPNRHTTSPIVLSTSSDRTHQTGELYLQTKPSQHFQCT
ncbi:uncharacterized protein LOC134274890 [Saccostrea cucullata]|uniref:uncharacterized protein LOC134274890 n=1 Tax=Saccostrea cuccullata TaxID=36930 RepID=UPI002ED59989